MQVLRLLIKLYESVENPDWVSISQCLLLLDDAPEVAKVIERLLKGTEVCPGATLLLFVSQSMLPALAREYKVSCELCSGLPRHVLLIVNIMQDDVLLAYQLCFDLFENESQAFNFKVIF